MNSQMSLQFHVGLFSELVLIKGVCAGSESETAANPLHMIHQLLYSKTRVRILQCIWSWSEIFGSHTRPSTLATCPYFCGALEFFFTCLQNYQFPVACELIRRKPLQNSPPEPAWVAKQSSNFFLQRSLKFTNLEIISGSEGTHTAEVWASQVSRTVKPLLCSYWSKGYCFYNTNNLQ